ncbi:MAG: hypothetical protein ACOCQ3_04060 [Natronomonas sp.]
MNLDELQSVQAKERQSSDLQHLRPSFYEEVGSFIEELRTERAEVVETADDPFSKPAVGRLTNDIETATATVEAIYERRIGKVVKKASIAAADMPVEADGLTSEERALFESLVERIESNREEVLAVLASNTEASTDAEPEPDDSEHEKRNIDDEPFESEPGSGTGTPDDANEGAMAADLMGASPGTSQGESDENSGGTDFEPDEDASDSAPIPEGDASTAPGQGATGRSSAGDASETAEMNAPGIHETDEDGTTEEETDTTSEVADVPRTTVRITSDVGRVVGTDNRDYHLGTDDVVTLPEPNARVLLEKDAATRVD